MLELESIVHNLFLLIVSIVVPTALYRLNIRSYILITSLTAVLSYFLFQAKIENLRMANHNLKAFEELQLSRGFSSTEYRHVKKSIFLKHHPDKANNEVERSKRLLTFQKMEGYLSMLADSNRRELFDKFNVTMVPSGADSDILYETKTNFVKNAAITTLPTAYGWLLGVTILMFWCRTEDFKLLINVLIGKALFSVYYLVIKNVHERDFIDYLLPYMTIFERIVLSDHVFMVIFSGIVLYILKRRDEKQPTSQLKSFFIRCKQASLPQDKFLELEDYSMALYSFQPYKED